MKLTVRVLVVFIGIAFTVGAAEHRGPLQDPNFFPIAVWLQGPHKAAQYKAAGINTYVGLWKGPTAGQLKALKTAGMNVVCAQNEYALTQLGNRSIIAWMHGDEPDNAQSLGQGKGYGPPIAPEKIVEDYNAIRAKDPSRPVLLNLGQGVAYDNYIGRGVRRGKLEDYPEYLKGCDIASFDIYPANHDKAEVAEKLEFVPRGVKRLIDWSGGKTVWNCIECTKIGSKGRKPTPEEVRSEVWMSLIAGSRGLIYFVHQFGPPFREAALLDDREMLAAVTTINLQIQALASVLNSPTRTNAVTASAPIQVMAKERSGNLYILAASHTNAPAHAAFRVTNSQASFVEVIDEGRTIPLKNGTFEDNFGSYGVHIYKID